eukprot:jgi/Botrbrau1/14125/Bobra.182_3s0068.1
MLRHAAEPYHVPAVTDIRNRDFFMWNGYDCCIYDKQTLFGWLELQLSTRVLQSDREPMTLSDGTQAPRADVNTSSHFPVQKLGTDDVRLEVSTVGSRDSGASSQNDGPSPNKKMGIRVTFDHIDYEVANLANKKEKLRILNNLSGWLLPGKLTALMGPSGCGKTTLLDILAARKTAGTLTGHVFYEGQVATTAFMRRHTGYVEQQDALLSELTVREMLLYTADLKWPLGSSQHDKAAAVDELISKLGLTTCKNNLVGGVLSRQISGGECKRTTVGVALVTRPRVLFLDEPTTGLDSFNAFEVMRVVRNLATDGITLCATVHCPTQAIFELFDNLLIMQRGRTVYFGPNSSVALDYFSSLDGVRAIGRTEILPEFIIDVTTRANLAGGPAFGDLYEASPLSAANERELQVMVHEVGMQNGDGSREIHELMHGRRSTATPTWWALRVLLRYRAGNNYRSMAFLAPRFLGNAIFAILVFTLYWRIGNDFSSSNTLNIAAVLFMWTTLPAYGSAAYVHILVLERPVYVRERADGLYTPGTYLLYKVVEEGVIAVVTSALLSVAVFFAVAIQGSWLYFWLVYLCTGFVGVMYAYFVAALSSSIDIAGAIVPSTMTAFLFFSGFLIRWSDTPKYWIWLAYLDFLRYAWGGLMVNQFQGGQAKFGQYDILEYYGLNGVNKWLWLLFEFVFLAVFTVATWLALHKKYAHR